MAASLLHCCAKQGPVDIICFFGRPGIHCLNKDFPQDKEILAFCTKKDWMYNFLVFILHILSAYVKMTTIVYPAIIAHFFRGEAHGK